MKTTPKISDTEWEVMRVVWEKHPITASAIIEKLLAQDESWHPKTVRTLLARLVQKRALGYEKHGNFYMYEPVVTEQQCVSTATDTFLNRVFRGSLKPMLAHFVEHRKLSKAELNELRRLLEQAGDEKADKPRRR
jgi:BlaI family penicillinase repressor